MRQKYDQGEDPLDPENGQGGGGGHPFRQGGHTFHFPGSLWFFLRLSISTSLFQVAIPLVEGSSSSTSTSKCHWTLLHRYLVVTWALSTHSPTSNDLRAFTQISQVASFLLSNRFLTAFGQCGGRVGKINKILIVCVLARRQEYLG